MSETVEVNTDLIHTALNWELHDKSPRNSFDQLQPELIITSYVAAALAAN